MGRERKGKRRGYRDSPMQGTEREGAGAAPAMGAPSTRRRCLGRDRERGWGACFFATRRGGRARYFCGQHFLGNVAKHGPRKGILGDVDNLVEFWVTWAVGAAREEHRIEEVKVNFW
jgi:hypothetical protein